MKKPGFKWNLNLTVIIIVIVILSVLTYRGTNIDYEIEKGVVKINWFSGVTIPIKDIVEVKVLDKTPPMTKVVGVEIFSMRQGTFSLEGIGRAKIYSGDISRKMVLIKTDKMTYGITPENASRFVRMLGIK